MDGKERGLVSFLRGYMDGGGENGGCGADAGGSGGESIWSGKGDGCGGAQNAACQERRRMPRPVRFHMPGHKGAALYREFGYETFLTRLPDADITEIPGADNLFQPEDVILSVMEKYARLYEVKKSYLLVNGTSGGILAAVMASVPRGKKLILARNSHKSVFNALILGGIEPVYAHPELLTADGLAKAAASESADAVAKKAAQTKTAGLADATGLVGAVSAEEIARLLRENPDAEAVIVPSPNYYGICSDIAAIAEVVHRAGKILIVDQAHGAHLKFFSGYGGRGGLPQAAEDAGADIVVNSIHKTLASFTQSAVLNVCSDRIDCDSLEDRLQMIETSSPSYLLMASLEINADILAAHGRELIARWRDNLDFFYTQAAEIPGLRLIRPKKLFDRTKLNLDLSARGFSGRELEEALRSRGIFTELESGSLVMCMTGIGNVRSDYERLLDALREIAGAAPETRGGAAQESSACGISALRAERVGIEKNNGEIVGNTKQSPIDDRQYISSGERFAVPDEKMRVPLSEAAGRICAQSIIPYPPGIPLVCPGEKITAEAAAYAGALRARGTKVIGITRDGKVTVGKSEQK